MASFTEYILLGIQCEVPLKNNMNNRNTAYGIGLVTLAVAGIALASAHAPAALTSTKLQTGKVTPWQAIKIAEQRIPGTAFSCTYASEDGKWGYDVIIIHNHKATEVELSATTGKVADTEDATAADEAKELHDDLAAAMAK